MGLEQRIVRFSGMVQGVGFRFTTIRVAGGYDVTGRVRNLRDGRVECVVEGQAEQIDAFLAELARRMAGYIRERTEQTAPYSAKFGDFSVAF